LDRIQRSFVLFGSDSIFVCDTDLHLFTTQMDCRTFKTSAESACYRWLMAMRFYCAIQRAWLPDAERVCAE